MKLRWKIFAILLGMLTGVTGALILEWYQDRKMRKQGYELECHWVKQ